jgi:hypothetical protein
MCSHCFPFETTCESLILFLLHIDHTRPHEPLHSTAFSYYHHAGARPHSQ